MKQLKVGGACLNQTPIDWDNNIINIKSVIAEARAKGVKILCLPELSITGYGCEDIFLSEWIYTKALDLLYSLVPYCLDIAVTIGLPLKFRNQNYNAICIVKDDKILGFYCKQFLANDGIHYEKRWFSPWQKGEQHDIEINNQRFPIGDITFDLYGLHTGLEICEDAWNPNRPACRLLTKGVELILNPSASHFAFGKSKTREELVISSSDRFNCYYLYANQLGNEAGRAIYDGDIIFAHKGKLLGKNRRLSFHPYKLKFWKINANKKYAAKSDPLGKKCEEFPAATALALYDYQRKSKSKGYTLSLSGGADSSSIAVLVAEMVRRGVDELGFEAFAQSLNLDLSIQKNEALVNQLLHTAYQGTVNSSKETFQSAERLANSIGARFSHWIIDDTVDHARETIEQALGRKLTWDADDIALQNIQARARSPLIWMITNISEKILLTTSNRSEGDVGYATMDGDMSGSLAPIAGVDKPFILEWLKYAENELGYSGLHDVNTLAPSAELRPQSSSQTDEDDLMPYPVLKEIELLSIRDRKPPVEVFTILHKKLNLDANILKGYILKFFKLWSHNQWKRERTAPSFHLDDFNVDPRSWCRFPILSGSFKTELNDLIKL